MQDKKESPKGLSSYMVYQEHSINKFRNNISGWYIDKQLCQEILDLCKQRKILFGENKRGFKNYQPVHLSRLSESHHNQYNKVIQELLSLYKEQYTTLKDAKEITVECALDSTLPVFQVQKYQPKEHYNMLHCENYGGKMDVNRVLAFMTYLNSIDEAGTYFPEQNFTSKAEQGLTLIWPAYFTHPHIGLPANKDTKIIVTGWLTFNNK